MNRIAVRLVWVILLGLCAVMVGCLDAADSRVESAGIGVSDMEVSLDYYTRLVGMSVKDRTSTGKVEKVTLAFEDSKGSDVVLFHYKDDSEVNYTDVPAKLVFYVPDAYALADAIRDAGYTILGEPAETAYGAVVGMAKDPDGYWTEIVQDPTSQIPYVGAVGIGVSDLEASADFYINVLGMVEQYRLEVPNLMNEIILQYPYEGGGSGVVLMHYLYPRNYTDNPVTLGLELNDPSAAMESIEGMGLEILRPFSSKCGMNPCAYGLAKDPDGYLLEIRQSLEIVDDEEDEEE